MSSGGSRRSERGHGGAFPGLLAVEGEAKELEGSVALVTGANGGLGRAFARALVARGARRVYGAALTGLVLIAL